jgi:predicted phage terminase large subunit-like protein
MATQQALMSETEYLAVLSEHYRLNFYEFLVYMWPEVVMEPYVDNFHIKEICDLLEEVGRRVINREPKAYDVLINIPPSESKSTICSVMWPAWLWANDPTLRLITLSNAKNLSMRDAMLSRDLIKSHRFQTLYGNTVEIRKDIDAKGFYKNTAGGNRYVSSVGSSILGEHAHVILFDDPNDPSGIDKGKTFEAVNDWCDNTINTRKVDMAITPVVTIQQRLAKNDRSGHLLKKASKEGKALYHLCLPAEDSYPVYPEELREKYKDGLMNPKRKPRHVLEDLHRDMGSRAYAGQLGQQPRAVEGNIVKRTWLPIIPESKVPAAVWKKTPDYVVDTAYRENSSADPSAILTYVEHKGYLFILDYQQSRVSFLNLIRFIYDTVAATGKPNSRVYIEPKASGISAAQTMTHSDFMRQMGADRRLNVIEWKMPEGNKVARLRSVEAFLEAKRVFLVEGAWNEHFIEEVLAFPAGEVAEPVDTLVMAMVNAFRRKPSSGYGVATI